MATERLGLLLLPEGMDPVKREEQDNEPGFGWVLSDNAKRDIEEIESNLRSAELRTGALILR